MTLSASRLTTARSCGGPSCRASFAAEKHIHPGAPGLHQVGAPLVLPARQQARRHPCVETSEDVRLVPQRGSQLALGPRPGELEPRERSVGGPRQGHLRVDDHVDGLHDGEPADPLTRSQRGGDRLGQLESAASRRPSAARSPSMPKQSLSVRRGSSCAAAL